MFSGNPVLPNNNKAVPDVRDPKVFNMNDKWIMSLNVGNKIEFFSSDNLRNRSALSEFGARSMQGAHGGVWECPDLLSLTVNR